MTGPGEPRPDDGGYRPPSGELPHVYNPYGNVAYPSSYPVPPAGLGPDTPAAPVRRPGVVHGALLLFLLAAAPYLLSGLAAALAPEQIVAAAPSADLDQVRAVGVDPVRFIATVGIVLVVVVAVFVLVAVLAWAGRRWARALVATMTAGSALLAVAGLLLAGAGAVLLLVTTALSALGVALLFGGAARAWYARPRP